MLPQSCRLQVEEFCYITDNTYTREQVRLASEPERVPAPLGPLCLSWSRRLVPCRAALVAQSSSSAHSSNPPGPALPQVLEMERELLRVLDFDLTQPTIKTFLRRYIKAASGALPPLGGQAGPCACTSPPPASSDSTIPSLPHRSSACATTLAHRCTTFSLPIPVRRRDPAGRDL